jgi:hypothetical protein
MTESGHAASFDIDLIIMASAGGVALAVGAAAIERHDGVCAEAGVIPQQGALAYGSCTQPGVDLRPHIRRHGPPRPRAHRRTVTDVCVLAYRLAYGPPKRKRGGSGFSPRPPLSCCFFGRADRI